MVGYLGASAWRLSLLFWRKWVSLGGSLAEKDKWSCAHIMALWPAEQSGGSGKVWAGEHVPAFPSCKSWAPEACAYLAFVNFDISIPSSKSWLLSSLENVFPTFLESHLGELLFTQVRIRLYFQEHESLKPGIQGASRRKERSWRLLPQWDPGATGCCHFFDWFIWHRFLLSLANWYLLLTTKEPWLS